VRHHFGIPGFTYLIAFLFVCGIVSATYTPSWAQVRKNTRTTAADSAARARQAALEAQRALRQQSIDSARTARQHAADSMRAARQRITDSLTAHRKRVTDSLNTARKHRADSLARIRKYRESRRYKDSVTRVRQQKIDERRAIQQAYFDSVRTVRKHITDSILAVRKAKTDSITAVRKARTDSLARIRKYKESKRYRDSVAIVRQGRLDSLRLAREQYNDSARASRKHIADSIAAVRKESRDSIMAVRKKYVDSITAVRKARADSLAKVKEQRERDQKIREKNREKRMQLALELKIKKKREAWSNEKMLKKKWSLPRKPIQNTFTHYNYYFNADHKMLEALKNMQRVHKENYDSLLALYPFDPDRDSTLLASDMDSIIQKASVGIQIHDPRTKWGDDLYLLLGQAYYYKGDYKNAAIAFRYIISMRQMLEKDKKKKKSSSSRKTTADKLPSIAEEDKKHMLAFLKHRPAHNEALLWLIRTYAQSHEPERAESVIELLASDPKFPEHLRGRLALEKAFLYLKENNHAAASEQLMIVMDDRQLPDWVRMRAAYINGQLQEENRQYLAAADNFRKVIALYPPIEMDFYSRKQLAYNLMYAGGDQQEAADALKRMLHDGKYVPYYEQIYYVLGRLSANNNQTGDAIVYLQKSIDAPKSTRRQKAISFASLGNVYYRTGNYSPAKTAYDSAAYYGGNAAGDSLVEVAVRRSRSLDEVTTPLRVIHDQDSLLALAALPEKEQRLAVRRYLRKLEQERNDSIFRAENALPGMTEGNTSGTGGYGNWYFSNATLMQQGMNEFKRKWGNRPLVDNWRRSAAAGFAAGNTAGAGSGAEEEERDGSVDENGLPTEESLMAAIPASREQQEEARLLIQRAYVDAANAYIRQLEDYPRAVQTLDTLDRRYREHQHQAEALYLRYLAALRQNDLSAAGEYSSRLLQEYPDSRFAALVKPTEDAAPGNNADVGAFYEDTYDLLMNRQFGEVAQRSATARKRYNDGQYNSKFTILEASALAGAADYDRADTVISGFIKANPADTLLPWAEAVKQYITQHRPKVAPPPAPDTSSLPKPLAGADSTSGKPPSSDTAGGPPPPQSKTMPAPASYTYNPRAPHYFLFIFPRIETKAMAVKGALTDFNSLQFSEQQLTISLELLKDQKGMLTVQQFRTADQARSYANAVKAKPQIFREYDKKEYDLLIISGDNYRKLIMDKDIEKYLEFYKAKYR